MDLYTEGGYPAGGGAPEGSIGYFDICDVIKNVDIT